MVDLCIEEEPEHVAYEKDHYCIPIDGVKLTSSISSWLSSDEKVFQGCLLPDN